MAQIFNRSANTLARASILGILLIFGLGCIKMELRCSPSAISSLMPAGQPMQTAQALGSNREARVEKWISKAFSPMLWGLIAFLFVMTMPILLHGFHARGFSLPQPVLLEIVRTNARVVTGLLWCIGYMVARQIFM